MGAREQIVDALEGPRCARELRERTGLSKKTVESALARMQELGLVTCVTPDLQQARLYDLTVRGRLLRRTPRPHVEAPPLTEYAWVQAGLHRRILLSALVDPMTPRELRQRAMSRAPRLAIGHVWLTLRELRDRGIVEHVDGRWRPTELGRRLQAHLA